MARSVFSDAHPNPMTDGRMQGFYFIAKSSPLPVSEGEAHLTYGIMSDVLRGKSFCCAFLSDY